MIDIKDIEQRFCRYVVIDTQSDPASNAFPSTEKQKDLGRLLVQELLALGVADAHLDDYGYVYATVPGKKSAPVICFCAHMDTAPDFSGAGVVPLVHRNWDGSDLVLPKNRAIVIRMGDHPDLAAQVGNDIVTASGDTLLGADNKAGVTAIMAVVKYLMGNPKAARPNIRILFTPDEEIGQGVKYVDMNKLGASVGYTIDGETLGSLENETFSADAMTVTVYGVPTHPGFAYGKMQNAIKVAGKIVAALPNKVSPEGTRGRQGFVHPTGINGQLDKAEIQLIVRDFDTARLVAHEELVEKIANDIVSKHPGCRVEFAVHEQYRNMYEVLQHQPAITEIARKAMRKAGLKPRIRSIRGGTDGSRLTFMGLPCPNLFAGEHAFHSPYEWVSLQDMAKSAETLVHLAALWAREKA